MSIKLIPMTTLSSHAAHLLIPEPGGEPAPAPFVWLAKLVATEDVDLFRSWLAVQPATPANQVTWQGRGILSWLLALRPEDAPEGGAADKMLVAYLNHHNQQWTTDFNDLLPQLLTLHQGHDLLSQALSQRAMTVAQWLVGPKALGRLPADIQGQFTWPADHEAPLLSLHEAAQVRQATAFADTLHQVNWPKAGPLLNGTAFLDHLLNSKQEWLTRVISARFPQVWDAPATHPHLPTETLLTPLQALGLVYWKKADLGKFRDASSQREYGRLLSRLKNWLTENGPARPYTMDEATSLWLFSSKSTHMADPTSWVPFLAEKTDLSEPEFLLQGLQTLNQMTWLQRLRLPKSATAARNNLQAEWQSLVTPSTAAWSVLQGALGQRHDLAVVDLNQSWRTWLQQQPCETWAEVILNAMPFDSVSTREKETLHEDGWWQQPAWYEAALQGPNQERHAQVLLAHAPEVLAHFRQQQAAEVPVVSAPRRRLRS